MEIRGCWESEWDRWGAETLERARDEMNVVAYKELGAENSNARKVSVDQTVVLSLTFEI